MRHLLKTTLHLTLGALALTGCGDDDEGDNGGNQSNPETIQAAMANYSHIVHASYEDSLQLAQALDTSLTALVDTPGADTLEAAKQAWLASREPYLQTEVYRFYEGPIDNETDGPEGLLNAWPLDEAYIDYVMDDDTAGIVNDTAITIDAGQIEALNEQGGEENVATGYHAIEFLLWGQDFNDNGPGDRPFTDYVTGDDGTAAHQDRRGVYLTTASSLMLTHLQQLVDAWAPGQSNYRAEFEAAAPTEGLRRVLTGLIVLSGFETGGERLQAALDTGDQEDEHSCFSDNTHRDMIQDIQGIQNVYEGTYRRLDGTTVSGTGIKAVIAELDATLAESISLQIAESLSLANALPTPFDQAIASGNEDGRAAVAALITSLRAQESFLEDAFRLFELTIPVVE